MPPAGWRHKAFVAAKVGQCFHQQHLVGATLVYQHSIGALSRLLYIRDGFAGLSLFRGGFAAPSGAAAVCFWA